MEEKCPKCSNLRINKCKYCICGFKWIYFDGQDDVERLEKMFGFDKEGNENESMDK